VPATAVLELRGSRSGPGVVANDHVDFDLKRRGARSARRERAGKSTLMNVLYGLYRPTRARSS